MIRTAEERGLPVLRAAERAAGACFADIGMEAVARDEPPPLTVLRCYREAGRAWVAVDGADTPVAYLLADLADGCAHIEQVSVHPGHAGRRLGRALVERVAEWARGRGPAALTLTAFTEVPWNGPYYERCGFRRLREEEVTPGLRAVRAAETAHGPDRWPRACMRREL